MQLNVKLKKGNKIRIMFSLGKEELSKERETNVKDKTHSSIEETNKPQCI